MTFVLVRHGLTDYNERGLANGDSSQPVLLSATGRAQCAAIAPQLTGRGLVACYCTRFQRTRESARLMWPDGPEPIEVPELDDIAVGEFEGRPLDEVRAWRHHHGPDETPPGGESRFAATARYARGFAWLAEHGQTPALVVGHEQPLRYALQAARGQDPIGGDTGWRLGNAQPEELSRDGLARAAELLAALASR